YNKISPAHASLTASVVIPYAGDWTVDVTQGTYNVQHFLGSPQVVTVAPAGTDPASCVVEIPNGRSITAGSSFEAVVRPFDDFENPTSHPEDSFKSRVELGNSEENFGNRHVLSSDHTFSELQTVVGAFGVVNLATYRGTKVAMKQLLTVNEENVLRFRHECFLMKNLSHPNVVQLVGVSWDESLFACCLEFVENGSLEFWLRLTAGGKKFVASKKPVAGKKRKKKPLSEITFQGFDHNGEYNETEHTDTDRAKKEEAEGLLHDWWMQRMNPKMNWTEMLKEDTSRLDHGMSGYHVDWTLKLTDFGEARAQNMGGTMTSVGTPIYIAPEVMRADHYDEKADTWSYGLCLVAMIRAERTLEQFFYQGDIGDEIKRKEEPKIELYSKEDDAIYRNRIGKEDEIEDSDEDEGGDKSTRRGDVVSKKEHERVVEAKDKAMQELKEKKNKEMDAVKKRADAVKKRAEAEKKRAEAEKKRAEDALQEKTAKEQLWGAALRELEVASPEDLLRHTEA
ncbi:hypothetical protein TeGR_g1890, partial [Tetraparma gracilis]